MIFSSSLGSVEKYTTEAAIKSIANHVRRLQEELEYRLAHLDSTNINEINADETTITGGPITLISKNQDEIAKLHLTDQQIEASVQGLDGDVSTLKQTANSLTATVQAQGGSISTLQQTANSLTATVQAQGGSISTLQQTAGSLTATVQSLSGDVSTLKQTATGLTATVEGQGRDISTLQQTAGSLTATVQNMSSAMSQTVRIAANGVTITNAAGSTLTIDGGQVDATNLNLTGRITFTDLDTSTQAKVSGSDARAYLESIGVTEITKDGVKSPRIEGGEVWGAEVYGGIFSNAEAENFLRMRSKNDFSDPDNWSMVHVLEHFVGDVDYNTAITQMGYVGGRTPVGNQVVETSAWVLIVLGNMVLSRDTSTGTMKALGKWDFSGATVTGL